MAAREEVASDGLGFWAHERGDPLGDHASFPSALSDGEEPHLPLPLTLVTALGEQDQVVHR